MALVYEDMVRVEEDRASLEVSLNEYILLLDDPAERLALKRRGPRRDRMILAMGQMAALFAAARCAMVDEEFESLQRRLLAECADDGPHERKLRLFYLSNSRRVAGANDEALERLLSFEAAYSRQIQRPEPSAQGAMSEE